MAPTAANRSRLPKAPTRRRRVRALYVGRTPSRTRTPPTIPTDTPGGTSYPPSPQGFGAASRESAFDAGPFTAASCHSALHMEHRHENRSPKWLQPTARPRGRGKPSSWRKATGRRPGTPPGWSGARRAVAHASTATRTTPLRPSRSPPQSTRHRRSNSMSRDRFHSAFDRRLAGRVTVGRKAARRWLSFTRTPARRRASAPDGPPSAVSI